MFVVHVFISDAVDDRKIRSNDEDNLRFLKCLGINDAEDTVDGLLIEPIKVPSGPFVPSVIPFYIGQIKTAVP